MKSLHIYKKDDTSPAYLSPIWLFLFCSFFFRRFLDLYIYIYIYIRNPKYKNINLVLTYIQKKKTKANPIQEIGIDLTPNQTNEHAGYNNWEDELDRWKVILKK